MPTIEAKIRAAEVRVAAHSRVLAITVSAIANAEPEGTIAVKDLRELIDRYDRAEDRYKDLLAQWPSVRAAAS